MHVRISRCKRKQENYALFDILEPNAMHSFNAEFPWIINLANLKTKMKRRTLQIGDFSLHLQRL